MKGVINYTLGIIDYTIQNQFMEIMDKV